MHTAASYKDPDDWETDALVNCAGTANIAKACKTHKVGALIYFQTALCYGTKPLQTPIRLDHPDQPGQFELRHLEDGGRALRAVLGRGLGDVPAGQRDRPAQRLRSAADLLRAPVGRAECFVTAARRDFCFAGDLAERRRCARSTGKGRGPTTSRPARMSPSWSFTTPSCAR